MRDGECNKCYIPDRHDNWQHYVGYIRAVMEISGRHSPTHSLNPPSSTGVCSGSDNSSISGFGGLDSSTGSSDKSSVSNGGEDSGYDSCDKEDPVAAAATHLTAVRKAANAQEHPDRGPSLGLLHLASTLHQHGDHTLSDTLCGKLCLCLSLFPWHTFSHYSLLHHYSHFLTHWGATPLFFTVSATHLHLHTGD